MRVRRGLLVGLALVTVAVAARAQDLLEPGKAFPAVAERVDGHTVLVRFDIAPGYYLYRDRFKFAIEPGGDAPQAIEFPKGEVKDDPFFGRVETYRGQIAIRLTLADGRSPERLTLVADSQGCADLGVCYPPFRQRLELALPKGASAPAVPDTSGATTTGSPTPRWAERYALPAGPVVVRLRVASL